ncbi:MAG: glutamate racemase [Acidobacteriota bacterium]|nr:glutamate racemase [Acidobacteriota bacterium]
MKATRTSTIGVFDSGFGGLTVLRELLPRIPGAHFVYLGDTARLPYGSKSPATIARYAVESARFLEGHGANHLVIACNTASALALPEITSGVGIPVTGVIAPAVAATHALHPGAEVLVLATAATVHSHAYRTRCEAYGLRATEKACPLLVPLVEEGWLPDQTHAGLLSSGAENEVPPEHHVVREILRIYLAEALATCTPQAVILGCTHYPLLAGAIEQTLRALGSDAQVMDSAEATAIAVQATLRPLPQDVSRPATLEFFATDSVDKFERLGSSFLGRPVEGVRLLDLGG